MGSELQMKPSTPTDKGRGNKPAPPLVQRGQRLEADSAHQACVTTVPAAPARGAVLHLAVNSCVSKSWLREPLSAPGSGQAKAVNGLRRRLHGQEVGGWGFGACQSGGGPRRCAENHSHACGPRPCASCAHTPPHSSKASAHSRTAFFPALARAPFSLPFSCGHLILPGVVAVGTSRFLLWFGMARKRPCEFAAGPAHLPDGRRSEAFCTLLPQATHRRDTPHDPGKQLLCDPAPPWRNAAEARPPEHPPPPQGRVNTATESKTGNWSHARCVCPTRTTEETSAVFASILRRGAGILASPLLMREGGTKRRDSGGAVLTWN